MLSFRRTVIYGAMILSLIQMTSCDEISHGLQRRKFEFLYKMNNFATIFREYTDDVLKLSDLELYKTRLDRLFEDINRSETVEGYGKSKLIKEQFLHAIDRNKKISSEMQMKKAIYKEFIKNEFEVITMRESSDEIMKMIEDEIIAVGKE